MSAVGQAQGQWPELTDIFSSLSCIVVMVLVLKFWKPKTIMRLEEYDYAGAVALAVVLLVFSVLLLGAINLLEQWASKFQQ